MIYKQITMEEITAKQYWKEWERTSPNEFMTPFEGFIDFAEKYHLAKLELLNIDIKETQEWYSNKIGAGIDEFDDYDAHVCIVANLYVNEVNCQ